MANNPIPALTTTVITGGSAVIVFAANPNGGLIQNPLKNTDQNISTAEVLYVDPTGNPPTTSNNGTTFALQPGETWAVIPNQSTNTQVNAVTSGHKFAGVSW